MSVARVATGFLLPRRVETFDEYLLPRLLSILGIEA